MPLFAWDLCHIPESLAVTLGAHLRQGRSSWKNTGGSPGGLWENSWAGQPDPSRVIEGPPEVNCNPDKRLKQPGPGQGWASVSSSVQWGAPPAHCDSGGSGS